MRGIRSSCGNRSPSRTCSAPTGLVLGFATEYTWARAVLRQRQCSEKFIESGTPTIVPDWATAERAEASANACLATKIPFIDAIAEVCEASSADVTTLADILGHDARIGRRGMRP